VSKHNNNQGHIAPAVNNKDVDTTMNDLTTQVEQQQIDIEQEQFQLLEASINLTDREARLNQKETELLIQEAEVKAGLPALLAEQIKNQKKILEIKESDLNDNENKISVAMIQAEKDKTYIEKELDKCRSGFLELKLQQEREIIEIKQKKFAELEKEISELANTRQASLQNKLDELEKVSEDNIEKNQEKASKKIIKLETEILNERDELTRAQAENEALAQKLTRKELSLENKIENIDEVVDEKVEDKERTFESKITGLKEENKRLLNSISKADAAMSLYSELKEQLGGEEPEEILQKLNAYQEEALSLKQQLLERPSTEIQQMFDDAKNEAERLNVKVDDLSEEKSNLQELANESQDKSYQIQQLQSEVKSLDARYIAVSSDNNKLQEDLKRLQPSYESEINKEERLKAINSPIFTKHFERSNLKLNSLQGLNNESSGKFTELQWLDNIYESAKNYGLTFSKRILYAFHTAIKTAEFSPITVLSGVSGTGKSELPRLYSHFGGINFLNLPVQPNWDCQESLLGYFNSIDNCFDAQPVLNLLAQSQLEKSDTYQAGMKDVVNMVLLDEMNLAHVELYFADFLSKLEERRGKLAKDLPVIKVKLGANIDSHKIPLGRNVLWVGTMNQDETTKSLSDKVLDRDINIHFPRPKTLESRKELKPLSNPSDLLPMKEWKKWGSIKSNLPEELSNKYRKIVEEINDCLATVGKALGHRVWQSIEYYMNNYPLIKSLEVIEEKEGKKSGDFKEYLDLHQLDKAVHLAFEDQLVQKIMPKLRGVETRGLGRKKCLDPIRKLLTDNDFNIIDDFDRACEFGFGQFMWSTSEYLNDEGTLIELLKESDTNLESAEKANKVDIARSEPFNLYEKYELNLKEIADSLRKELHQLTLIEIKNNLDIEAKEAKEIKDYLNTLANKE